MNNLFFYEELNAQTDSLDQEELAHLRSLRLREGDLFFITNGKGLLAEARLELFTPKKHQVSILRLQQQTRLGSHTHLAVAPLKNTDRLAWLIEKAVELGIQEFSVVQSTHCERAHISQERLLRKAIAALKQSLTCFLPKMNTNYSFEEFVSQRPAEVCLIPHIKKGEAKAPLIYQNSLSSTSNCIFVGPEGGFSDKEIALAESQNWLCVSLGEQRLRTETAALVAASLLHQHQSLQHAKSY